MIKQLGIGSLLVVLILQLGIQIVSADLTIAIVPQNATIHIGQSILLSNLTTGDNTTPPYTYAWYLKTSSDEFGQGGNCGNSTQTALSTTNTLKASPSSTTYYCLMVSDQDNDSAANVTVVYVNNTPISLTSTVSSTITSTSSTSSVSTTSIANSIKVNQSGQLNLTTNQTSNTIPPQIILNFSNNPHIGIGVAYDPAMGNVIIRNVSTVPNAPLGFALLSAYNISSDTKTNSILNVTVYYNCTLDFGVKAFTLSKLNGTWIEINSSIDKTDCQMSFSIPSDPIIGIMDLAAVQPVIIPANSTNSTSQALGAKAGGISNGAIAAIILVIVIAAIIVGYYELAYKKRNKW